MPTCPHPKPLANTGTRYTGAPAARAWCPKCKADTGWLDGTRQAALDALASLRPPVQEPPPANP